MGLTWGLIFDRSSKKWFEAGVLKKKTKSKSSEYTSWTHAKSRCYNPKDKSFEDYGGRGITMYIGWINNFDLFFAHVGPKPTPNHSIDRIDNDRGYEPGNVRWATRIEQSKNRRPKRCRQTKALKLVQICCEAKSITEWCRIHNITRKTFYYRVKKGWDVLEVFNLKPSPK